MDTHISTNPSISRSISCPHPLLRLNSPTKQLHTRLHEHRRPYLYWNIPSRPTYHHKDIPRIHFPPQNQHKSKQLFTEQKPPHIIKLYYDKANHNSALKHALYTLEIRDKVHYPSCITRHWTSSPSHSSNKQKTSNISHTPLAITKPRHPHSPYHQHHIKHTYKISKKNNSATVLEDHKFTFTTPVIITHLDYDTSPR